MTDPIAIDVWSDIACPFCYIGKRKLEAAAASSGIPVDVTYHSFELDPDAAEATPGEHAAKLAKKLGVSLEQAQQMGQQMAAAGAAVGLTMDYSKVQSTRTLKAHELLHYALAHGLQAEMKERLLAAYFAEGVHVGHIDALADLAAEVGLDRADVVRSLEAEEHLPAVQADIAQARAYGIQGVPFFVIDGKYSISGAQDSSVFEQALQQVRDERVTA